MKKLTKRQINKKLNKHELWIKTVYPSKKVKGEQADFTNCDVSGFDFSERNINYVNFTDANCSNCNFENAKCHSTNFTKANCSKTNFTNASLSYANFTKANCSYSIFNNAYCSYANFKNADCSYSIFNNADFNNAELLQANCQYSSFVNTDCSYANLTNMYFFHTDTTDAIINFPIACPEKGAFIGFKKAISEDLGRAIVELEITEDALRSSGTGRMCRCNKAKILSITGLDGECKFTTAYSIYNNNIVYKVGEILEVKDFDTNRFNECTTGIHFFMTKEEAINRY